MAITDLYNEGLRSLQFDDWGALAELMVLIKHSMGHPLEEVRRDFAGRALQLIQFSS